MAELQLYFRLLVAITVAVGTSRAWAAPDDQEELPVNAQAENNVVRLDARNFEQWVFPGAGNAKLGMDRINARLELQLDDIDGVCGLNAAQRERLSMAARGDIKRFGDEVDELRRKFMAMRNDQNAFGNLWQEIQPLQRKQAMGLFGDKSLFASAVRKSLAPEQVEKYTAVIEERRRFRYRATIENAVATLDSIVAFRQQQRDALIKVLVENTDPPLTSGQYDYILVMYRLSRIAARDVKPLMDDRQWNLLQQQFKQYRFMRDTLVQNGVISADEKP